MTFRTLFILLTACVLSGGVQAQTATQAAIVDGADIFFYYDIQGLTTSPYGQALEGAQTPEQKAAAEEQFAKFTEITGLEEDDISNIAFSMDIDGIDFASQDPSQLETAQAVMAVATKKPLTLEQMRDALVTVSETSEGPAPTIEMTEVDGVPVLQLTSTETPGGMDKAFATVSEDGKTVLLSFNMVSLKGGLARLATATPAAMSEEMTAATTGYKDSEIFMTVVLPAEIRALLEQGVQGAAAQGGMGGMLMPFASTRTLMVSVDTAENLDVGLSLDLGVPGNAQQAAGMIQSMLPMMMMGLQQQAGPEAMNLMNKIKTSADGGKVKMTITLTPEESSMIMSKAASAPADPMPMDTE